MWVGISFDEWSRSKDSDVRYIRNRYPLLEKATRMTRLDCIKWLTEHGFDIPPKSSCTHCVYHDERSWQELKRLGGSDWQTAVDFDAAIRDKTYGKTYGKLFIHRSGKPLNEAVKIPEDTGNEQLKLDLSSAGYDEDTIVCDVVSGCWS